MVSMSATLTSVGRLFRFWVPSLARQNAATRRKADVLSETRGCIFGSVIGQNADSPPWGSYPCPPNRLSRSASSSTFAKMFAGDTFALLKSRAATVRPSSFRPQGLRSSASCWMTSLSLPPPTRSGLSIVGGHARSSLFCAYRVDWWWDSGATVLLRWASRRCCLTANLCR